MSTTGWTAKRTAAWLVVGAVIASTFAAVRPTTAEAATDNLVPARGAYLGAWADRDGKWTGNADALAEVAELESLIGRKLDINQHFYSWTNSFPTGLEHADRDAGRIPLITWKGTSLDPILSGSYDDMIRARARNIRDFGTPLFLRWGWEMNGKWSSWGGYQNNDPGTTNGPAKYRSAWRRIHSIFQQEGAANAVFVWSPNASDLPRESWNHWTEYYPGDAYVDWVAPDGYNWGESQSWSSWYWFSEIFEDVYRDYAGRKPIMIAETGSQEAGGSKAEWMLNMWYQIELRWPAVKALVYFHAPTWHVDTSEASLRAFREMANDEYFKQKRDTDAPRVKKNVRPRKTRSATKVYMRTDETARVRVLVYKWRGGRNRLVRVVALDRWTPALKVYGYKWDGRDQRGRRVAPGKYFLRVVVWDRAGNRALGANAIRVLR